MSIHTGRSRPAKLVFPNAEQTTDPGTEPSREGIEGVEGEASPALDSLDAERRRLAERLRETREFLGLSQQEAAEAAGLTRLVVSAVETGRRKMESVELQALARVYGQPVSYFLPGSDEETQAEVQFIARAARGLAAEDRAELLRFAEFLKSYKAPATPGAGMEG